MKLNGLIYLAVAVLVILAGWIGRTTSPKDTTGQANASLIQVLQAGVKTARAQLRASGAMVATLRASGEAKDGKLKVAAATITELSAKLAGVSGGGPSTPGPIGWKNYKDKFITAKYNLDTLKYTLADRPLKINIVEGLDNEFYASVWDVLADCPAVIDRLDIQRNKDWQPPNPWYKKLATIAKYTGVAAVAGTAGYLAGKIF